MSWGLSPKLSPLQATETLDAPRLSGTLDRDGVASLNARDWDDRSIRDRTTGDPKGPQNPDLESRPNGDSAQTSEDSDDTIEDYDQLELDPDTLMADTRRSIDDSSRPPKQFDKENPGEENTRKRLEPHVNKGGHKKRDSIPIRLEKTGRRGRYILTADDPEIREILQRGIAREKAEASGNQSRVRIRDLVFTRRFTTFDRQNPASADSPFFGFFTLFWIAMVLIFIQVSMKNWRDYGSILGRNQIMTMMFSRDVLVLAITDGVMCAACFEGFFMQTLVRRGYINWAQWGWIAQNFWQSAFLGAVVGWTYFREWPWTHTIFLTLHGLVFVMKQHSYAFYNGYLSGVYKRRTLLERKLQQLETMEPVTSPPNSPTQPQSAEHAAPGAESTSVAFRSENGFVKHRPPTGSRTSTNFDTERSDVASVASAIESGKTIDHSQMQTFATVIQAEIAELDKELQGKSTEGKAAYPKNLTLGNLAEFICLPTLVYELEYPRQDTINWWYVLEKTTATFGVLCVMMVISQAFIYPLVAKTVAMKEAGMSIEARWREFPFIVSDMLFPLLIEQLLTWYLIWECILNVLAELTRFADRGFYGDWWNSVTWDQYARDWNRPVHNFLLRHVYHSSISTFHLGRHAATFVTFLLSALVHEMCMALMFRKVRGYLFCMQLLQMPLVAFSRSKLMKGRTVLGNTVFWMGLFIGPSFLTSLYLVI